jgi:hypothetical protein
VKSQGTLNVKAKSRHHFAPAETCYAEGTTVEILQHPFSFQRDLQKSGG